jgi:hypothetical protein
VRRQALAACVLGLVALGSACVGKSEPNATAVADNAKCSKVAGANLLANPSFEDGTDLAQGWTNESSATGEPIYTLSTTTGVVDGEHAQRVQYSGQDGDDGTKKVEFYQGPVDGIAPGQTVEFSMCVSGAGGEALSDAYAIIGVETFTSGGEYISDVSTNVTAVEKTPTQYVVAYTVPDRARYLAVYVQSPEIAASGAIDLYFDAASLVVVG